MQLTIKDIARIAGVSHSTVSRCLNNKGGCSEDTCLRIKKISSELGFEFNANARSLSTAKTGTIGIIFDEDDYENTLHPFTMGFQKHIRRSLERADLDTIITFSRNRITETDNVVKLVNKGKVDGVIIIKADISHSTINFLRKSKIPFVFSHLMPDRSFDDVDCVFTDHVRGGYLAGEHLADKGCRRLLCITRSSDRSEFSQRTEGFLSAASDSRISSSDIDLLDGGNSFLSGYKAVKENLSKIEKFNGIFVHTDIIALGVIKALVEENINVPGKLSVIGYDGLEFCEYISPTLSTIEQPAEKISILTCERLIDLMSGVKKIKTRRKVIPPALLEREST